jgi:hypothetical protein
MGACVRMQFKCAFSCLCGRETKCCKNVETPLCDFGRARCLLSRVTEGSSTVGTCEVMTGTSTNSLIFCVIFYLKSCVFISVVQHSDIYISQMEVLEKKARSRLRQLILIKNTSSDICVALDTQYDNLHWAR